MRIRTSNTGMIQETSPTNETHPSLRLAEQEGSSSLFQLHGYRPQSLLSRLQHLRTATSVTVRNHIPSALPPHT